MTYQYKPWETPMTGDDWLGEEHILWRLMARLTGHGETTPIEEGERAQMAEHLAACETCRAGLAALDLTLTAVSASEAEAGAEAHADAHVHQSVGETPDDVTLASYATLLTLQGPVAAMNRYPGVAAHVAGCDLCQEALAEITTGLADDIALAAGPDPAIALSQQTGVAEQLSGSIWQAFDGALARLRQPLIVMVRPRALSILHQVIEVVSPAQFAFRAGGNGDSVQSFSLDLRDGSTTARRWIRLHVWLRAEYSRRVSGQLEFFWREDPLDDTPATGVTWTITQVREQPDMQVEQAQSAPAQFPAGASDERGISRFLINDEGAYELTIQGEEREWVIPFTITYSASADAPTANPTAADLKSTEPDTGGASETAGPGDGVISVFLPVDDAGAISMRSMDSIDTGPGSSPMPSHRAPATYTHDQRLRDDFGTLDIIVEREMRGGFSVIAMGPDRVRGRWVAVKSIRRNLAKGIGDEFDQRLQEAFTEASLHICGIWPHPNLLLVEDVTKINRQTAQVLAYAAQGNLRDLFTNLKRQGGWLTLDAALRIAQQIAAGMVALHTPAPELMRIQTVVHADLKPENILLRSDGRALIADLDALAFRWPQEDTQEQPTVEKESRRGIAGTPAYMAPERWQSGQFAPPSDVYALGLLLSELISGRHALLDLDQPHTLEEWRMAHEQNQPRPLEAAGSQILDELQRLYQQMLAKRPEDRPSMAETLAMLQEIARSLGIEVYVPHDVVSPTAEATVAFWLRWAEVYCRFERYPEALVRVEAALRVAPRDPAALRLLAEILAELGRYEEVVAACALALDVLALDDAGEVLASDYDRRRALILEQLGVALTALKRYAEAEAAYAEALTLDPTDANAWDSRARNAGAWAWAEQAAGQMEAAQAQVEAGLKYIAQALRLNPEHPNYRNLEQALLQLREALRGQG